MHTIHDLIRLVNLKCYQVKKCFTHGNMLVIIKYALNLWLITELDLTIAM